MLATALFTLLLFALSSLDVAGRRQRASIVWAVAAGVLWSLLFLTIYSALLLLVPLVWYLIVVTKRDTRAVAAFVLAAFVLNPLTLGCLYRNARLTGNPVFNAHLLELPMDTATYPGASLYRSLGMRQSVPQYLAAGGMGEVGRKAVHNVLGYYQNLPVVLGVFVLPLFLIAALTRFTNPAINRLRTLVYAALGLHVLGLSLFIPYRDGLPLLVMYAPFASVIATAFFLNFLRARNLSPFYAKIVLASWAALACVPGLVRIIAPPAAAATALANSGDGGGVGLAAAQSLNVYTRLNTSPLTEPLRARRDGLLVSDVPQEMAYYTDLPTLWLPPDYNELRESADRAGVPVRGIILTPVLDSPALAGDPTVAPWRALWKRFSSFAITSAFLNQNGRESLNRSIQLSPLFFPQEVRDLLRGDTAYVPRDYVSEQNDSQMTLIWWEK
jgi:hypothetical protein